MKDQTALKMNKPKPLALTPPIDPIAESSEFSMERIGQLPPPLPTHLLENNQYPPQTAISPNSQHTSYNKTEPNSNHLSIVSTRSHRFSAQAIRHSIQFGPNKLAKLDRDYSASPHIKFQLVYPALLAGKITKRQFLATIDTINQIYARAQPNTIKAIFTFFADMVSCYTFRHCMPDPMDKVMSDVREFIRDQNAKLYHKAGIDLVDPFQSALLYIEVRQLKK